MVQLSFNRTHVPHASESPLGPTCFVRILSRDCICPSLRKKGDKSSFAQEKRSKLPCSGTIPLETAGSQISYLRSTRERSSFYRKSSSTHTETRMYLNTLAMSSAKKLKGLPGCAMLCMFVCTVVFTACRTIFVPDYSGKWSFYPGSGTKV